jgi:hypothetical protein
MKKLIACLFLFYLSLLGLANATIITFDQLDFIAPTQSIWGVTVVFLASIVQEMSSG